MIIKGFFQYDNHYYNYIHANNIGNYIENIDKLYVGKSYVIEFYDTIQRGTFLYKTSKTEPHLSFTLNFEGGLMTSSGNQNKKIEYKLAYQYQVKLNNLKIYEYVLDTRLKAEMTDYWHKKNTSFLCKKKELCEDIEANILSYL